MAYDAVAQSDHHAVDQITSDLCASPNPTEDLRPALLRLSLDLGDLGDLGGSFMEPAKSEEPSTAARLSSLIRPGTSASYEIVKAEDAEIDDDVEEEEEEEEDDDDDRAITSPAINSRTPPQYIPRIDTTSAATLIAERSRHADGSVPELPLRSPSSDDPVPLTHPTPDLQSLQGAYVGNIERLEKSAERLSLSSADLGSEIRKMDREQKRCSGSSVAMSFAARSETGASMSAAVNASSPRGSIMSASRTRWTSGSQLNQVIEPDHDHEDIEERNTEVKHAWQLSEEEEERRQSQAAGADEASGTYPERPATAASDDTFQQGRNLFTDFDGVHFIPADRAENAGRRVPHRRPPLANAKTYPDGPEGDNMVYYPAPVPMMLNLPPRLSQKPIIDREKRRTQLLGALQVDNNNNRKSSAAWLAVGRDQTTVGADDPKRAQRLSTVPPQLRASVFFEHSPIPLDIEVRDSSAVATLDSILDASALAPVTAFTDHPFAGHAGAEVYGKPKPKSTPRKVVDQRKRHKSPSAMGLRHSSVAAGQARSSSASLGGMGPNRPDAEMAEVNEESALHESYEHDDSEIPADHDGHDESEHPSRDHDGHSSGDPDDAKHEQGSEGEEVDGDDEDGEGDDDGDEDDEYETEYFGPPTTLLAELELRKKELQQRRRTAAVGIGLHSTLLELDAVAQKQSEHRRQRPVTLAWEDPVANHEGDEDDEDVPLAMLYPSKNDDARPLGLLERREIEENEPLSKRRARLRGEPLAPVHRPSTIYSMQIPVLQDGEPESDDEEDEEEGETLGERLKRLKAKERVSNVTGSDLASEIMEALGQSTQSEQPESGQGQGQGQAPDKQPITEQTKAPLDVDDGEVEEEETLAQRRSRLQREGSSAKQPQQQHHQHGQMLPTATPRLAKARSSMANILQMHPVSTPQSRTSFLPAQADYHHHQQQRVSTYQMPANLPYVTGYSNTFSLPDGNGNGGFNNTSTTAYGMPSQPQSLPPPPQVGYGYGYPYGNGYKMGMGGVGGMMGMGMPGMPMAMAMTNPPIDPGQREVIDRWRQSIRQ